MLCKKCGYLLNPNDSYCINCGEPVENNNEKEENKINNNEELEVLTLDDSVKENNIDNLLNSSNTIKFNDMDDKDTKFENNIEENNMFDLTKPLKETKIEKGDVIQNIEKNDSNENNADNIESLDLDEKLETKILPKKENKNGNSFLLGLLIGLLLMVIAVALTYVLTRKLVSKPAENNDNKVTTEKEEYRINYLGNIVKIPNEYTYEVKNNELLLASEDNDWTSETGLLVANFDKLKNNFAQIKTNITTLGYTAGNIEVKKINNKENIVVEIISQAGVKFLCVYTKVDDNSVFYTVLASKDNSFNYNALEEFLNILAKVQKTDKVPTLNPSLNNVYMSSFILMP